MIWRWLRQDVVVAVHDEQIAEHGGSPGPHFGQVRAELYRIGLPIGPYDMMIAGHARACGLTLVTNNVKEFERIQGLRIENWAED